MATFTAIGAGAAQAPAHGPEHQMDANDFAPASHVNTMDSRDFASRVNTMSDEPAQQTSDTTKSSKWRGVFGRKTAVSSTNTAVDTPNRNWKASIDEKERLGTGSGSTSDDEERRLEHIDTTDRHLQHVDTAQTTFEQAMDGKLFRENGELVLQPAPTSDPRDPLNIPTTRKALAVFCMCFFGALAASAELILGAMLPVFAFVYGGLDPKLLEPLTAGGLPAGQGDGLKYLSAVLEAGHGPPIWRVYLLASLPVLMIGVSNLLLIPLAIAIGRRPVILGAGCIAIGGALWAGFSTSLNSHLGARAIQAFGAGTVESLVPFIVQDMVFVHQRNTWISFVFAAQGVVIIGLGFAAPYIIINLNWRYVYYITAAAAGVFLVGVFFFLPETRWPRSRAEMNGVPRREDPTVVHQPRTLRYNVALFHGKAEWKKGLMAFVDTMRTFFYPQIFFITMLNSAMISAAFAAGYTVAPALLTKPWDWPFLHLGFCLTPVLIAAILAGFITGVCADWVANYAAKKRGLRVPENQLFNLVLPTACALVGTILFALAGGDTYGYSWVTFLTALGLMAFGFLGANTVGAVYVLECYPHLAGPALVNIASVRCIIAFVLTFKVSDWIVDLGYFDTFIIYTGIMGGFAILIPVVYYCGPSWRKRWPASRIGEH